MKQKELFEELLKLQLIPDKILANKIKTLTNKIIQNSLDNRSVMNYISINVKQAKKIESKQIWMKIMGFVKQYYDGLKDERY